MQWTLIPFFFWRGGGVKVSNEKRMENSHDYLYAHLSSFLSFIGRYESAIIECFKACQQ